MKMFINFKKKMDKKKTAKNGKIYSITQYTDINNKNHTIYMKMLLV